MKYISRRSFLKGLAALSLLGLSGCASTYALEEDKMPGQEKFQPPVLEVKPVDYDYLLTGGTIVDGTGSEPYQGNIAIKENKIVGIGHFVPGQGGEIIDIEGLTVAPGFIDLHTHTERYLAQNGRAEMMLLQGVTTHIGGNCGTSEDSIGKYFDGLGAIGINIGLFAGLKTIRMNVAGTKDILTKKELEAMKELVAEAMEEGAFGLSVGLQYWPQIYTTTEEVIELCKVVADYGGFYSTHIRNEEDYVIPSVEEAIKIGFEAGVPVEYSHIKTAQRRNWGKMSRVLELVEEAYVKGLDITADVYGYEFSSLDVGQGRSSISEDDMITALKHPLVMVGSDSGLKTNGSASHPRAYGNHPRILGRYVREKEVISLAECIKKMTSQPARRLGLHDRGLLQEGNIADIAVFDFEQIIDKAERYSPNHYSEGIKHVFVNGKQAVKDGQVTGVLAGQVLKHRKG
ncbi:MAG: N-acyl-D-amino-acid deacylase [Clostridia bacterium]|nr:N-acyl-D-amino-acid deacylase [Clostridia bacterium]